MKYVWLEGGDAVHPINGVRSAYFACVYATKSEVLKFWKGLGGIIEFITDRPSMMEIIWHKGGGKNVLRVAYRRAVHGLKQKEEK